jgi:hypothetical protein
MTTALLVGRKLANILSSRGRVGFSRTVFHEFVRGF